MNKENEPLTTGCVAADIAGYCTEIAAWRLLRDISTEVAQRGEEHPCVITPSSVAITEDGGFILLDVQEDPVSLYAAPECREGRPTQKSTVWSMAATVFKLVMGCDVFNGRGGRAQHKGSKIPYMREEMPDLSQLLCRCLSFLPQNRPEVIEIHDMASLHFQRCLENVRRGPRFKAPTTADSGTDDSDTGFWPEEMIDIHS